MKIKAGIIYSALPIINELAEKPMQVSLVAKMLRLADDLQKECNFIDKQRKDIIEKYGKKDESGELIIENGNVTFEGENVKLVEDELNELGELEIDIKDREINEDDLTKNNIELTMAQFSIFKNFIHTNE